MIQKPKHLGVQYAEVFKDASVVEAYQYRPPYPAEVFEILRSPCLLVISLIVYQT